jgi:hypothetical protein
MKNWIDFFKNKERDLLNEDWVYNRKVAIDIAVVSVTKQEGIKKKED